LTPSGPTVSVSIFIGARIAESGALDKGKRGVNYIEVYCKRRRRYSTSNYKSPVFFEKELGRV
jgi:hypothetical protein